MENKPRYRGILSGFSVNPVDDVYCNDDKHSCRHCDGLGYCQLFCDDRDMGTGKHKGQYKRLCICLHAEDRYNKLK